MIRRTLITLPLAALLLGLVGPAPALAAGHPALQVLIDPLPANFAPGADSEYLIAATNTGAAATSGPLALQVTLPAGITPLAVTARTTEPGGETPTCTLEASGASCQSAATLGPGREWEVHLEVAVSAGAEGSPSTAAAISGGGAPQGADATTVTPISSQPVPFGFQPGFQVPAIDEDGLPATAAGSHPYQMTVDFALPTERQGTELPNAGHPRDTLFDLPPGLLGDPAASPVLCTEAEFEVTKCPEASQLGVFSLISKASGITLYDAPLYGIVPPPGAAAELGFEAAGVGIDVHLIAGIRSDGDYGITTTTPDVLALGAHPVLGARVQLWGDASGSAHDEMRGTECVFSRANCGRAPIPPLTPQHIPFLTLPGACPAQPPLFAIHADDWEEPGLFRSATYGAADAEGNPVSISGCNALSYEPTVQASPTTDLADSPTGLDVDLHQPQEAPHEGPLSGTATAELKDAHVTLPAGMTVNPSQADGLATCSEAQIGYLGESHYSEQPQTCPDAAKLGTVEVTSPLLVRRNAEQELVLDPETGAPLPEPLHGSVFLARPFKNQFGSLLAIYLAIEDPATGIVSKLAGRIEPDPATGQLTTTFAGNPQLLLEDIRLDLFGGARGALISPLTCGTHTTTTDLVPWSTPEGADAHPQSSFQTSTEPGGGACPTSEATAPNAPTVSAGTETAQAGAYSPFVLKLSRADGSQRLTGIDTTLPEGLTGKLAGIPECGGAQIAQAESRSRPEEGVLERESPSCPAATEVGTVVVAAGAGPSPYYTQGHAYLAGPYKGAPLSLAVITPAIAGPFDLGTVVIRVALHLEPETVQIHAVSDPLPTILDGIPLDIRSVALRMSRPGFTLNPTSCEPMAITGQTTSSLGQTAPFSERFQVGGCSALPFKPKLALRLVGKVRRTAHPRLIANLTAKEGEANIARAQVKLPHSVFLDQSHIKTVCTRVQFAAASCPAGSIYGSAEATSPLLGYPISGPVYLRSSSHQLPDLVAQLKGPASQPIEIDLDGKTDSVKGALRNTFEAVPDASVSTFHLELFGGKRGLIEMSNGFCAAREATVKLTAHSGKIYNTTPAVAAKCPKPKKAGHKKHAGHKSGGHGGSR
jgi:hypothetical protein